MASVEALISFEGASPIMRRVVIEFPLEDLGKIVGGHSLDEIKSLRVIHVLKETPAETAMICRVELKNPSSRLQDFFSDRKSFRIRLVKRDPRGACIYNVERRRQKKAESYKFTTTSSYLSTPFEIGDGKVKVTFLGSARQVKSLLQLFEREVSRFRVLSLGDAKFSLDSPLGRLTDKQTRALVTAYNLGYYEIPRRTNSDELARLLKISNASFVMERRRAERRLLAELLGGEETGQGSNWV